MSRIRDLENELANAQKDFVMIADLNPAGDMRAEVKQYEDSLNRIAGQESSGAIGPGQARSLRLTYGSQQRAIQERMKRQGIAPVDLIQETRDNVDQLKAQIAAGDTNPEIAMHLNTNLETQARQAQRIIQE